MNDEHFPLVETLYDQLFMSNPGIGSEIEDARELDAVLESLIRVRKQQKLRQSDLADRMNVSQARVSQLETGVCDPQVATLQNYARALGVRLRMEIELPSALPPVRHPSRATWARDVAASAARWERTSA